MVKWSSCFCWVPIEANVLKIQITFLDSNTPFGTKLKYFFLPASAAFFMNVILFACTAWKIYSVQTSLNKIASDPENRLHKTYKEEWVKSNLFWRVRLFVQILNHTFYLLCVLLCYPLVSYYTFVCSLWWACFGSWKPFHFSLIQRVQYIGSLILLIRCRA